MSWQCRGRYDDDPVTRYCATRYCRDGDVRPQKGAMCRSPLWSVRVEPLRYVDVTCVTT